MSNAIFKIIGAAIGLGILVNFLFWDPEFPGPQEKILHAKKSNQVKIVEQLYSELVAKDFNVIDHHYNYIESHFNIPKKIRKGKNSYDYRDDKTIRSQYRAWFLSSDSITRDIGCYGLGLIFVNLKEYEEAKNIFLKTKNQTHKYWNNSIGNVYSKLDQPELAKRHFYKEIELKGNISGAYSNLSRLLLDQKSLAELKPLIDKEESNTFISISVQRKYFLMKGDFVSYLSILFAPIYSGITVIGILGAILILGIWVIYIRKIDIYEPERWKYVFLTLGLGMLFCFFTFLLSDLIRTVFDFHLNGKIVNDFFYAVIGIGATEELVKIIPLLLLLKFTKIVNESYDYIFYASLSALGFAFVENLLYFDEYRLHIISSRAIMTSVGHMFLSSIIAYAFILNRYRYKDYSKLRIILFFGIASLGHGFYDFWLINEKAQTFSILSIVFFLSGIFVWNSFKNNALNNSEFFDENKRINHKKLADYLIYCLSGVILFEYVALSIQFGPTVGNRSFFDSILSGGYLLFFISSSLGQFKIERNKWYEIKFWGGNKEEQHFDGDPDEIINHKISLTAFSRNEFAEAYLPNTGTVIRRLDIMDDYSWYLIKLNHPATLNGFYADHVLIRPKESGEILKKYQKIMVGLYLIKDHVEQEKKDFEREDLEFVHWARAMGNYS